MDQEQGKQVKAVFVKNLPPNTLTRIERYLGLGMANRIGPAHAGPLSQALVKGA